MATLSAFAIIGEIDEKGNKNRTHFLVLSDNDRPCLELFKKDSNYLAKIIPTPENMLDDIYFMIYTFVLKLKCFEKDFSEKSAKSMYGLFSNEERTSLYNEVKLGLENKNLDIEFYVWSESRLCNKLDNVALYPVKYDITTFSSFKKFVKEYEKLAKEYIPAR